MRPLALAILVAGCAHAEPTRAYPQDLSVHVNQGGMRVPVWHDITLAAHGSYQVSTGGVSAAIDFTLSAQELDALYHTMVEYDVEHIRTREEEGALDRGGTTVAVSAGGHTYAIADAGGTFIVDADAGRWNAFQVAIAVALVHALATHRVQLQVVVEPGDADVVVSLGEGEVTAPASTETTTLEVSTLPAAWHVVASTPDGAIHGELILPAAATGVRVRRVPGALVVEALP